MGRLRALIFDMDGVLIHSRALHVKAWDLFFRRHGVDFDSELLMKKYFGRSNGEILKATLPPALGDRDPVKLSQEKESLFREIANRELRPVAGLMEFLEHGRRVGLQMCVASSAPKENVEFVARRLKIGDYFEALIDDSCAPRAKPAPDLFLLAARRLNAPPDQCMVFEDSHHGVAAAKAAGMECVGFLTQHGAGELKPVILEVQDFSDPRLRAIVEERMRG